MTVITGDPEVHLVPAPVALGVGANLRHGCIADLQRVTDDWRVLAFGVRRLVDSRERNERIACAAGAQPICRLFADAPIDGQPAADIATKVSRGGTGDEHRILTDSIATT